MNKKSGIFILTASTVGILIIITLVYSYFMAQLLWGIIAAVMILSIALVLFLFLLPADSTSRLDNSDGGDVEISEPECEALADSRVYEKPGLFFGVPLFIVIGRVSGIHESVFSIAYGGGKTVVLYRGICLVSKGDRLKITGKWRGGKQFGIQGNVVVADRVENVSSGIVFEKA
ncbi:hypothetical protein [Methanosarcina lacustris]|nr:hypothetical protein [Methanosarcina lacustris]